MFDYRGKPPQFKLLPTSAHENVNAGNIFRNTFIEYPYTQMKLFTETSLEEIQSVVLETDELKSQKNHMYFQVLDFSINQVSAGGGKTKCLSVENQ